MAHYEPAPISVYDVERNLQEYNVPAEAVGKNYNTSTPNPNPKPQQKPPSNEGAKKHADSAALQQEEKREDMVKAAHQLLRQLDLKGAVFSPKRRSSKPALRQLGIDTTQDGNVDSWAVPVDTNGDSNFNAMGVDTTGDGELDHFGIPLDTTGDGIADAVALDTKGDMLPDRIFRTHTAGNPFDVDGKWM